MPRSRRRALLIVVLWLAGVATSVTVAFAAVSEVARGVAPANVARLSSRAIDRELRTGDDKAVAPTVPTTGTQRPAATTTSTRPAAPHGPSTSAVTRPTTTSPPATSSDRGTTTSPAPTAPPPPSGSASTVTWSVGGTVSTRCVGPTTITLVAAVPAPGFERVRDVETGTVVEEWFAKGAQVSKIHAECSDGVVHAEVEAPEQDGAPSGD